MLFWPEFQQTGTLVLANATTPRKKIKPDEEEEKAAEEEEEEEEEEEYIPSRWHACGGLCAS